MGLPGFPAVERSLLEENTEDQRRSLESTLGRGISGENPESKPGNLRTFASGKGPTPAVGTAEAGEDKCQAWPFGLGQTRPGSRACPVLGITSRFVCEKSSVRLAGLEQAWPPRWGRARASRLSRNRASCLFPNFRHPSSAGPVRLFSRRVPPWRLHPLPRKRGLEESGLRRQGFGSSSGKIELPLNYENYGKCQFANIS